MNESMLSRPEPQIIEIGTRVRFIVPFVKPQVLLKAQSGAQSEAQSDTVLHALEKSSLSASYRIIEQQRLESRLKSRLESILAVRIVIFLLEEVSGKLQLAKKLGHKTVSGELHKQIKRLLEMGIIEMTLPEKPNSRLQKYRLTDAGRMTLDMQQSENSQGDSDE